ncbi:MAG: 50S ribosomal protein L9 [Clostridiaceae bacterium]|jgi:large subunit ribosomal protein L9|nr:50S ribosomal protein L9 [Clostridiaceae bacterium]
MKVLLTEGVKGLGQAGDVVDVKPGYARNYLFRRGLACEVTKANMNEIAMRRKQKQEEAERQLKRARETAEALEGQQLVYAANAGTAGRLYGTVTTQNIADLLKEKGFEVDKRNIQVDEAIKTVGTHQVMLKLHPEVSCRFVLDVKADV